MFAFQRVEGPGSIGKGNTYTVLIDSELDIDLEWLQDKSRIGVTAGASAPELLVQNVVKFLQRNGAGKVTSLGFTEDVIFPLPKPLREPVT